LKANTPSAVAPVATFAVFALQAYFKGTDSLDTVTTFTSLALIHLVASPAAILLSAVPQLTASLGCFTRIQNFLVPTENVNLDSLGDLSVHSDYSGYDEHDVGEGQNLGLYSGNNSSEQNIDSEQIPSSVVLTVKHAKIILPSGESIFEDLTFDVPRHSLVSITGPIGSGKTTLLKAILGEIKCTGGSITLASSLNSVGYCAQSAWIPHGTIQQVICNTDPNNMDNADKEWYHTVVDACALTEDMKTLVRGDATEVGSRGTTLSGGQKQRIALARAIYQRPSVFLLDSVLNSLDNTTKIIIIKRLFGLGGLLRSIGSTVIMVTYDRTYMSCISIQTLGHPLMTPS
jgi:ATP-binding cassette subfamily C (CFTR/MRP) protein 1